jgi:hypothetical protein
MLSFGGENMKRRREKKKRKMVKEKGGKTRDKGKI